MGKYGSGITLQGMFKCEKAELKDALKKGNIPADLSKYIIDTFENAVYHALQANIGAKALEEMMEKRGIKIDKDTFHEYIDTSMRIGREFTDYEYEDEVDEDY